MGRRPRPVEPVREVALRDGLSFLEHVRDGRLPLDAFSALLDLRVTAVERGALTIAGTVGEDHTNRIRTAHGGFLSTLMDLACGYVVHSAIPPDRACPHIHASYRFLRGTPVGTELTCTARVLHLGRTTAAARCELADAQGRLVATGESTHQLIEVPGERQPGASAASPSTR